MRIFTIALLSILYSLQITSTVSFQQNPVGLTRSSKCSRRSILFGIESDLEGRKGLKGYYRRPSRAIEKGGGFFVPGLEGERIRVLTAGVLLVMLAANRSGVQIATSSQIVSEVVGIVVTVLLFLQGLVEAFDNSSNDAIGIQNSYLTILQSSQTSNATTPAIESVARSIIQTCGEVPYVLAVSDDDIVVELGPVNIKTISRASAINIFKTIVSSGTNLSADSGKRAQRCFVVSRDGNDVFSKQSVDFPSSTMSVIAFTDARSWLWIIASNKPAQELSFETDWLTSLLSVPIQ